MENLFTFKLDYSDVPGATAATFRPKDVFAYGDTLYVVNDADNNYSLEVFSIANGGKEAFGKYQGMDLGGCPGKGHSRPDGVTRANGKIYVTHEVAERELMRQTIGLSLVSVPVVGNRAFADCSCFCDVLCYKGLIMIHDKHYIDIVEERNLEPEKGSRVYIRSNIWVKPPVLMVWQ